MDTAPIADSEPRQSLTFLLDVDNTLLDNDRLKHDIGLKVEHLVGQDGAQRFWDLYEEVRHERDFVDYPTTVRRYGDAAADQDAAKTLWHMLESLDFSQYLYPMSLAVIAYLGQIGRPVILSDGDPEFQPLKIRESGLAAAVDGRVLIYVHKEEELPKVFAAYPADHYVMIDDKARILAFLERCCPSAFTTVHVLQGHYADEAYSPEPDYTVESIGDLLTFSREQFLAGRTPMQPPT